MNTSEYLGVNCCSRRRPPCAAKPPSEDQNPPSCCASHVSPIVTVSCAARRPARSAWRAYRAASTSASAPTNSGDTRAAPGCGAVCSPKPALPVPTPSPRTTPHRSQNVQAGSSGCGTESDVADTRIARPGSGVPPPVLGWCGSASSSSLTHQPEPEACASNTSSLPSSKP